jgi:hypothetical protein
LIPPDLSSSTRPAPPPTWRGAAVAAGAARLISAVPHGHWKITTFVAGLRQDGVTARFVIDRAMNGAVFAPMSSSVWRPPSFPAISW